MKFLEMLFEKFGIEKRKSYEIAEKILKYNTREITKEEREKQRISFAYGNVKLSNDDITREMVEEQSKKLYGLPDDPSVDSEIK